MKDREPPALQRRLGLALLVLYGTGITVGAGIYVLIGAVARHAGPYAPWSFVIAGLAMAFTVASYAELAARFPVSAGEAAYVREAFDRRALSRAVGLLTVVIGIVSSSAVAIGAAGYIREFVTAPEGLVILVLLMLIGAVASYGILESVVAASVFTVIEIGGLLLVVIAALLSDIRIEVMPLPPLQPAVWAGVGFASLLAFFAFIGFEDLANVAEEAKSPERDLPRAMAITLVVSTVLYVAVAAVAVSAVPPAELGASKAPLSLVFQRVAHVSPATISVIAIIATLNTILAQLTMVSRVIYGMARQGDLPRGLSRVNAKTNTPLVATWLAVAIALALALAAPIERLAEGTSIATLVVFAAVNLSLIALRRQGKRPHGASFRAPVWSPWLGLVTALGLIALSVVGT
jgi:APA family basic amino acid/polyamine antiporter